MEIAQETDGIKRFVLIRANSWLKSLLRIHELARIFTNEIARFPLERLVQTVYDDIV
jgi:hypothetical protein